MHTETREAPKVISRETARQLLEQMQHMTQLFQGLTDGSLQVQDGAPLQPPKTPTVKEQRARARVGIASELPASLHEVREPKRQRKERNLSPRTTYSLKQLNTAAQMREVQSLTPGGSAIVVYLAMHPKVTVPELMVQLDLRRKTVQNLLSVLSKKNLIEVGDV